MINVRKKFASRTRRASIVVACTVVILAVSMDNDVDNEWVDTLTLWEACPVYETWEHAKLYIIYRWDLMICIETDTARVTLAVSVFYHTCLAVAPDFEWAEIQMLFFKKVFLKKYGRLSPVDKQQCIREMRIFYHMDL